MQYDGKKITLPSEKGNRRMRLLKICEIVFMDLLYSKEFDSQNSKLDDYLNNLYDNFLRFSINPEELYFLQTAVESILTTLCNNVISSTDFKNKKQRICPQTVQPLTKTKKTENYERAGKLDFGADISSVDNKTYSEVNTKCNGHLNRQPFQLRPNQEQLEELAFSGTERNKRNCVLSRNDDVCAIHSNNESVLPPIVMDLQHAHASSCKGLNQDFEQCYRSHLLHTEGKAPVMTRDHFKHTYRPDTNEMNDGKSHVTNTFCSAARHDTFCSAARQATHHPFATGGVYNEVENDKCSVNEIEEEPLLYHVTADKGQTMISKCDPNTNFEYSLLKVGSFYEGTTNIFPGEFDFIVLLGDSYKKSEYDITLLGTFHYMLQAVVKERYSGCPLRYCNDDLGFVVLERYCEVHGPASKLKCVYYRCHELIHEAFDIHIDVSPAYRLLQPHTVMNPEDFLFTEWYQPIMAARQCLLTYSVKKSSDVNHALSSQVSITEYEHFFMTTIVSEKHRKVYQLVKYLINGQGIDEKLKMICKDISKRTSFYRKKICGISSYAIKVMIFHHHYGCSRDESLSECVLDVLRNIQSCFHTDTVWFRPYFSNLKPIRNYNYFESSSIHTVSTLKMTLVLVHCSESKITILEQYLMDIITNLQTIHHEKGGHALAVYPYIDMHVKVKPWSKYALGIHQRSLKKMENRRTCMTVVCIVSVVTVMVTIALLLGMQEPV